LSYSFLKKRILKRQGWGINICCGKTDGGGINADIIRHKYVPNFILIKDIYNLPFRDQQFETVLSSHTIEHVDHPEKFYRELKRIGKKVSIVIPPLWDITAALNVLEHKFIFLSFKKEHAHLPPFKKLPLASFIHKKFGQHIKA
jgi:ubiquinone/menaquinone biosynthesis C-methylase UbiE